MTSDCLSTSRFTNKTHNPIITRKEQVKHPVITKSKSFTFMYTLSNRKLVARPSRYHLKV